MSGGEERPVPAIDSLVWLVVSAIPAVPVISAAGAVFAMSLASRKVAVLAGLRVGDKGGAYCPKVVPCAWYTGCVGVAAVVGAFSVKAMAALADRGVNGIATGFRRGSCCEITRIRNCQR